MELSSMLAGEPFTDRPECVCPVIAEFLRTYNDEVDQRRRQDLYAFASHAVETRTGHGGARLRANMILRWWMSHDRPRLRAARVLMWGLAPSVTARDTEIAYRAAQFAAGSPELHASVLALLDDLVAVARPRGSTRPLEVPATAVPASRTEPVPSALGLRASCAQSTSQT
jgi:hypothetical protein